MAGVLHGARLRVLAGGLTGSIAGVKLSNVSAGLIKNEEREWTPASWAVERRTSAAGWARSLLGRASGVAKNPRWFDGDPTWPPHGGGFALMDSRDRGVLLIDEQSLDRVEYQTRLTAAGDPPRPRPHLYTHWPSWTTAVDVSFLVDLHPSGGPN